MGRTKHGLAYKHPLYTKWKAIRNRCNNPSCADYERYGNRGIKLCERWNNFENFYNDNIDEYNKCEDIYSGELLTTERIDVNRGYVNGNITFVPNRLQSCNREFVYKFKAYKGDTELGVFGNLKEFCRDNGLKYCNLKYHFKRKTLIVNQGYRFVKLKGGL